ncbi:hypothetical protein MGALJ_05160 [Mycobacterium gallinarum]|uniref:Uncharacterized protein n=1 Tax=Mycobacterium gallinarum TaxID=39689 RepID=A0A9W4AYL4_9MYCO|nr:hypothetical protein MGALJ_05160 [Mycobacterium gallinarum]
MPAKWMSNATSCGPTSRRVMVVSVSGAVADVAAYAETVVMKTAFHLGVITREIRRDSAAYPQANDRIDLDLPAETVS